MFKVLKNNISANLFGNVVQFAIKILGIPVFMKYWGNQYYGEWLILFTIPEYLGFSDIGLGVVATNEMVIKIAHKNYIEAQKIFVSVWYFIILLSLSIALIFLVSNFYFHYEVLLKLNELKSSFLFCAVCLISYSIINMLLTLLGGVLRAENRYSYGTIVVHSIRLLEFIGTIILVFFGYRASELALFLLLTHCIAVISLYFFLKKKYTWLSLKISLFRNNLIRKLLPSSISMLGFPLGFAFFAQGVTLLVGANMGAIQVVYLNLMRVVIGANKQLIGVIQHAIWPELTKLLSLERIEEAKIIYYNAIKISIISSIAFITILYFFAPTIFFYWTANKVDIQTDYWFFVLMLVSSLFNIIWTTSAIVSISINKHAKIAIAFIIINIIFFIIPLCFINTIGLIAVAMGQLLLDVSMTLYTLAYTQILLNDKYCKIYNKSSIK